MRKQRPLPILLGEPSPSLAKINKMNPAQLAQRIQSLSVEAGRIARKIEHLKLQPTPPQDRIEELSKQFNRLGVLEKTARERLESSGGGGERRYSREYRPRR